MRRTLSRMTCLATLSLAFVSPAAAGALGGIGVGGVTNVPGQVLGGVNRSTGGLRNELGNTVQIVARDAVGRPTDARIFERDNNGARVLRRTVLLLAPSPQDLAVAKQLNFEVSRSDSLPSLGLSIVQLRAPGDMDSTTALAALRKADPSATFDYEHIYDPSGGGAVSTITSVGTRVAEPDAVLPQGARVGMIDGGIARHHEAFTAAALSTRNAVADGDSPPTEHGTAIASLLVGRQNDFHGMSRAPDYSQPTSMADKRPAAARSKSSAHWIGLPRITSPSSMSASPVPQTQFWNARWRCSAHAAASSSRRLAITVRPERTLIQRLIPALSA